MALVSCDTEVFLADGTCVTFKNSEYSVEHRTLLITGYCDGEVAYADGEWKSVNSVWKNAKTGERICMYDDRVIGNNTPGGFADEEGQ